MLNEVINNILCKIQESNNIIKDIKCINNNINSLISNFYFNNKVQYLTNNKGKNIRSLLALNCFYKYKTNSSYDIDILYQVMTIIELTHFASLLHDDVIDNSIKRRSEKSLNYLYGNKNSILIGDFLLSSNVKKILNVLKNKEYGQYIIEQFIKASSDTAYGAYLENNSKYEYLNEESNRNIINSFITDDFNIHTTINEFITNLDNTYKNDKKRHNYINNNLKNNIFYEQLQYKNSHLSKCLCDKNNTLNNSSVNSNVYIPQNLISDIQQYIRIASLKTGSLFKLSCICGCVLSNTDFHNIKQSAIFGLCFGIIYQIQNDLNDYKYNNYQESEDYIQSNTTLPIIILSYIADTKQIFNNKTQKNFLRIKQLINTMEFNTSLNNIISKYLNKISYCTT